MREQKSLRVLLILLMAVIATSCVANIGGEPTEFRIVVDGNGSYFAEFCGVGTGDWFRFYPEVEYRSYEEAESFIKHYINQRTVTMVGYFEDAERLKRR